MAITQTQLDAMEKAYYDGIKSVTFGGRTVIYQDMSALWHAIQIARQELSAATGAPAGGVQRMRFSTLRGF